MRVVPTAPISAAWPARLPTGPALHDHAEAVASGPLPDRVARPWSAWLESLDVPEAVRSSFQRIRAGAAVVVTGQQPVVLGGPLMVLVKAARAVTLARALEQTWKRPVAPVFWVAGDDHDLGEMLRTDSQDAQGALHRHRLEVDGTRTAANALRVPEQAQGLLEEFAARTGLPSPERYAHRPGDHLSDWFARVLMEWLGDQGLVPLDPACLDQASLPLFEEVLRRGADYQDALQAGADQLERAGVQAPLPVEEDPPLFLVEEGQRRRLRRRPDGEALREDEVIPVDALLAGHREGRWRLSANVSLRVLLQDRLLPVAAYVAGPAERLYQAQLGPLHEAFAVTRPPVVPRPSATVVPRAARRHLRRLGLTAEEWFAGPSGAAAHRADRWLQRGQELQEQVRAWLGDADPELAQAVSRQATRVQGGMDQLLERARSAAEEGAVRLAARRAGVDQILRPGGAPQERRVNALSFLAECGEDLRESLLGLPADAEGHWLLIPEDENHG